jgi:alkaline phosphatase
LVLATALITACAATPTATRTPIATTPAAPPQVEVPVIKRPDGETAAWWFRHGAAEAARRGSTTAKARNLILFVGDGMSLTTVAAARILAGQRAGQSGEEYRLSWEDFGHTALSRTYNTDLQTPDSAGTMSAMATGVKTRGGVISVDQSMKRGDCTGLAEGARLSLWELAADAGLETGVVTTARLTHATPAATLAHVPDRNWEADIDTPEAARTLGCIDIAQQMIANPHGHGPTVLMGGGRVNFMPASQTDPEYPEQIGRRKDGRDLIAQWQQAHPKGSYVWNNAQLAAAPQDAPLLGLFEPSHMQWEHERNASPEGEPSLAQMTRAAIERLRHNDKGFVLLVEGGRIDHGNHNGNAFRALKETIAMSDAVRTAREMTSEADTLILVTADHSHSLVFTGYPDRGNPILGLAANKDAHGVTKPTLAKDGLPYTTLVYANGPGHRDAAKRPDPSLEDTAAPDYLQQALVPLEAETHGGDDVGLWASGPGADAVRGNIEQNTIFHLLLQAQPALRQSVCARYGCTAEGVPVNLPQSH